MAGSLFIWIASAPMRMPTAPISARLRRIRVRRSSPAVNCSTWRDSSLREVRADSRRCCGIARPPPLGSVCRTRALFAALAAACGSSGPVRRTWLWIVPEISMPRYSCSQAQQPATAASSPISASNSANSSDDLMPDHPILVSGVDRQQVDPAGVDHRGSVRGRQPAFGVARIRHQSPDVVADLHGGEVVDRARPSVVGVDHRHSGGQRIGRAGDIGLIKRAGDRLVHQRPPHLGLPVPRARVVVDGERVVDHGRQDGIHVRDRLEPAAVWRREIPLPPAPLEPGAVILGPVVNAATVRQPANDIDQDRRPSTLIRRAGPRRTGATAPVRPARPPRTTSTRRDRAGACGRAGSCRPAARSTSHTHRRAAAGTRRHRDRGGSPRSRRTTRQRSQCAP